MIGSRPALAIFLDSLQHHGPGFGLCPNLSKCEVFWPSGNQGFSEFPSSVWRVILSDSSGPVFLGSPIWGPPGVFAAFVDSIIERVSVLQGRLRDLDNPQVELHLLRSCLGVCKLNHLLHTVSPDSILPQLQLFDSNLRHSLSCICNSSVSDQAWHQATLPLSLGGLGLCEASCVSPAAFLGSCVGSQELCYQLLASFHDSAVSFPAIPGGESAITCLSSLLSGGDPPPVDHPSKAQSVFQHSVISIISLLYLIHVPCEIRLESGASLITPLLVLGCGPFLLNPWA